MYFSNSAVNVAFDLGAVDTETSRFDNSFSSKIKTKKINDLFKTKKYVISASNDKKGGELDEVEEADKAADGTVGQFNEESDVNKLTDAEQTDKDLARSDMFETKSDKKPSCAARKGEELDEVVADKAADGTVGHFNEGSDVNKLTDAEQTDKDLARSDMFETKKMCTTKCHDVFGVFEHSYFASTRNRGVGSIRPVIFLPTALSLVCCLALSIVAAKNVTSSEIGIRGRSKTYADVSSPFRTEHQLRISANAALQLDGLTVQAEEGVFFFNPSRAFNTVVRDVGSTVHSVTREAAEEVLVPVGDAASDTARFAETTAIDSVRAVETVVKEVEQTTGEVITEIDVAVSSVTSRASQCIDHSLKAASCAGEAAKYAGKAVGDESMAYLRKAQENAKCAEDAAAQAKSEYENAVAAAAELVPGPAKTAAEKIVAEAKATADAAADAAVVALEAAEDASARAARVAVEISQEVKDEVLEKVILPLATAAMDFLDLLNDILREIFQTITNAIYKMFFLQHLDNLVKDIIVGGSANFKDVIHGRLGDTWDRIKSTFEQFEPLIDTIKTGLDKIGSSAYINQAFLGTPYTESLEVGGGTGNESNFFAVDRTLSTGERGLIALAKKLEEYTTHIETLSDHINAVFDNISDHDKASEFMDKVVDDIKQLMKDAHTEFRDFLRVTENMGSIQFLVTFEADSVAGVVFEVGVSIDVRQLIYFLAHDFNWDPLKTQLASVHVGYALDVGVQGGGDVGFSIALHTSACTGVNGFGWGISLEGAFEYAVGLNVAWPLPGDHIPNQFVAQVVGAGAKVEMAAFVNHAIILAYFDTDLGFLWAAPSLTMAKFSGNPSLYYSKYPWKELGVSVFNPSAQGYFQKLGWDECKWDNECSHPDTTSWDLLDGTKKHAAEMLGFEEKTWNAPSANDGWAYTYPLEEYFRNYQWSSMLSYEQELFTCLGWNEAIFDDHDKQPDDWSQQWDDLPIVKQICATAIGYHRPRWNSKIVMYEWKSLVNHLANDLCIELKNSDTANGNAVVVSTCNGNPNQKWYIDLFGRIRSKINMNKCIDAGNSNQLYVKLFISTCNDQAGQKWVVESNGRIRSEPYNKYIGVSGGCGGVSAGSRLELHAKFEGNPNCESQQTWIHDVWRPFVAFQNHLNGNLCIDLKGADTSNRAEVQLLTCNDTNAQMWFMDTLGRIRSKLDMNKCIEAGGDARGYAKLFIWDCHDQLHQQWTLEFDGRFRNKENGYNIGVAQGCGGISSGRRLEMHKYYGNGGNCETQQKWHDYRIVNFKNGLNADLCIGISGAEVIIWTCNGNDTQKWFVDLFGRIRSKAHRDKCIDAGNSNQLYAKLFLSTCNDQAGQKWLVESSGRIYSGPYNKYIGVSGGCGGVSAGRRLELHDKFEGGNCESQQRWISQ